MSKATGPVMVLMLLVALSRVEAADEKQVGAERRNTLYAIGLTLAKNLEPFQFTKDEFEVVKEGLADGFAKKESKVSLEEESPKIQALIRERQAVVAEAERKESDQFLAKAAGEEGASRAESGIIMKEIEKGSGQSPKADSKVKVHYHGTLRDGTVFDSSRKRGQPAEFALNQVIPCWTEALQKMKVGGKAKIVCPAALAYGNRGAPPTIKPGAALVFEVELLDVVEETKAEKKTEQKKAPAKE